MSDRRREKELKRKHKKEREAAAHTDSGPSAPAASKELVARELGDPARLVVHLRRLSELMTMLEELRPARFVPAKLIPALLGLAPDAVAKVPEADRGLKLRELILPGLIDETLAKQARAGFEAGLKRARNQEDQLALFAGRTFMDSWIRAKGPAHQSPAWDTVFGISVLDALFEGHLMAAVVRFEWPVDEMWAAKSFTKALAKPEIASELENLGLTEKDPQALAKSYGEVARMQGRSYLLGFDALLHLVRANHQLSARYAKTVLAEGATAEVRKLLRETFDECFKDDVTSPLAHDLASEIARRLAAIKKGEAEPGPKPQGAETREQEKKIALVVLSSLRAIPVEHNAVLRNTFLSSFEIYKNVAPVEEVPFIRRIWGEPTDRWALEEYEKFLMERRQNHRAQRVHRFLTEVRAEAREKQETEAKGAKAS